MSSLFDCHNISPYKWGNLALKYSQTPHTNTHAKHTIFLPDLW